MISEVATLPARPKRDINFRLSPVASQSIEDAAMQLDPKTASRAIRPGQELVSEGRRCTSIFIIAEGISIRYRVLRDGQRQILSILLPGDFAGIPSCFFSSALYSIRTLTPAVVWPVSMQRVVALFDTQPRVAARLFWTFSCETAVYAERLISVSRRSASERVAHFLLELHARMHKLGLAEANSFRLPLTQEILSDALGLSIPYVNRVLQQLKADGLARIKDQEVIIEDMEALLNLADFEQAYLTPLSLADFAAEPA
jgi:CRP-like cAMP-binding protein